MASDLEIHKQKLDDLFERYLSLLDEYQIAQLELSSSMSSGFLSLAQANRSAPAGIRRYGQDYYDNRMQSGRSVVIETKDKILHFSVVERSPQDRPDQNEESEKNDTNIEPKRGKNGPDIPPLASNERDENPQDRKPKDPIRWYGFSVPSSLRVAQAQFTTVVKTPVPRILHVTQEMRQLENEIGRLRKMIKKLENT